MAQVTNFNSNNTENGWIYKYFSEKINKIETDIVELMNTVEQAYSDMKISLNEYQTLIKNINSKCSVELYNTHVSNNSLHVSSTEKAIWNSKLDLDEIKEISVNINAETGTPYEINIIPKGDGRDTYIIPIKYNVQ